MGRVAEEPDNNHLLTFCRRTFFDYFPEKEGFLNRIVV